MNLLMVTGMEYPQKYGSLEKWFVEISRNVTKRGGTAYIAYEVNIETVSEYIIQLAKVSAKSIVIKSNEDILNFCRDRIDAVCFMFSWEKRMPIFKTLKSFNVNVYPMFYCECFFATNLEWKRNLYTLFRTNIHRVVTNFRLSFSNHIFGASNAVVREYEDFYRLPKNKISTLYLGLPNDYENLKSRERNNDIPIIACTAFHSSIKGVDVLLKALQVLKSRGIKFKCIQMGGDSIEDGGVETAKLINTCDRLGLNSYIEWTGAINDVKTHLLNSDIYCQPSRNEAISFSIAEAMACHLPVIATKVGGIPELVDDSITGYLVESEDYEAMADKLELLISNKRIRREMGNMGAEKIKNIEFYQSKSAEAFCKRIMI